MNTRKYAALSLLSLLILALSFGLTTACSRNNQAEAPLPKEFQTRLLVTEPLKPLLVNEAYVVRSRVEAPDSGVSHVELYVVEFTASTGETQATNILVSSQAPQPLGVTTTIFNAEQLFIPKQPGEYAIQVIGYDQTGEVRPSEFLRFEVASRDTANQS